MGVCKMSKVNENLMAAFAGESQANRKYLAYAAQAEKEGKTNAARMFKAAAEAETIHAMREFRMAGNINSTEENLKAAIEGESYETESMYPEFKVNAEEANDAKAAKFFDEVGQVEGIHARLYQEVLDNIDNDTELDFYLCPVCGNIETSKVDKCPVCNAATWDKFVKF